MKSALVVLIGVALLAGGGYALLEGGHFTTRRQVAEIGGVEITAKQKNTIAPWMAGSAMVVGTAFLFVGFTRKL